jgi:hypothetical protein
MANRREILRAGLAMSMAPVLNAAAFLFPGSTPADQVAQPPTDQVVQPFRIDGFVFDNRFVESVEAGRSAARHGSILHEIDGDVTDLWYHDLDSRWRGKPSAWAGITGDDALFVLENLAWDRRLRVMYRGRHAPPRNGLVEHALSGLVRMVDGTDIAIRSARWTYSLGESMARCSGRRESAKTIKLTTTEEMASGRTATLMSWIIVPSSWGMNQV